jgi:hypothetical protein
MRRHARSSANALAGAKAFVTTKAESAHGSRRSHPLVTMSASRSQLWAPAVNSEAQSSLNAKQRSGRTTAARRLSNFSRLFAFARQTNENLSGFGVSCKCGRCCPSPTPSEPDTLTEFPALSIALRSSRAIPFGDDFSPGSGRGFFAPLSIALPYRICVTLSGMTRKLPDTCAYGHIIDGSYCAPGKKPRRYCKKCAVRRVEEMRERRKAANTKVSKK